MKTLQPRYCFGSLLFVWKVRHPDSDNILRFLSVCDSFLYSSYRFYPASDQVQEPLFFFKGTLFNTFGLFPDGSESCVRTLKGPEVNNLKCEKESMEMNSLTFENGSGIINRMLRLLNRKCTGSEVLSVPSIIFSVTMTWMETTVFATILAMTALSYHRHKQ